MTDNPSTHLTITLKPHVASDLRQLAEVWGISQASIVAAATGPFVAKMLVVEGVRAYPVRDGSGSGYPSPKPASVLRQLLKENPELCPSCGNHFESKRSVMAHLSHCDAYMQSPAAEVLPDLAEDL